MIVKIKREVYGRNQKGDETNPKLGKYGMPTFFKRLMFHVIKEDETHYHCRIVNTHCVVNGKRARLEYNDVPLVLLKQEMLCLVKDV